MKTLKVVPFITIPKKLNYQKVHKILGDPGARLLKGSNFNFSVLVKVAKDYQDCLLANAMQIESNCLRGQRIRVSHLVRLCIDSSVKWKN